MINIKKISRIGVLLLVLCLISTTMMAGTFAKYTSDYSGKDTALIAKWKVTPQGGKDGTTYGAFADDGTTYNALDLFSHSQTGNIVANAGTNKVIAPGVGGDFYLKIENTGDVAAKMTFDFTVDGTAVTGANAGKVVPIEYQLEDSEFDTDDGWVGLDTLEGYLGDLTKMKNVAATIGSASVKVNWKWPHTASGGVDAIYTGSSDANDTALGTDSAAGEGPTTYILKIKTNAEQIASTPVSY